MNIDGSSSIPPYQNTPSQGERDSRRRQLFHFDQNSRSPSPNSRENFEEKQFSLIKKEPGSSDFPMDDEEEEAPIKVKTEPEWETNSAPTKRLPSINEVREGIKKINPNFDPEKEIGVENCLPCTISFYNWILSGAANPETVDPRAKPMHEHMFPALKGDKEKDYINRRQDDFYLQDAFLNDLNNPKVVHDLDGESKEYICLTDDLPLTFGSVALTELENKIGREIENDGVAWQQHGKGTEKFKVGILFLNHRQDESRAHFLSFLYLKSPTSSKYVLHIIDPQNGKMSPFQQFIRTAPNHYTKNIKIWSGRNSINYDCNKTPKEIFAELKKEKTKKQNQSNELARIDNAVKKTPIIKIKRPNEGALQPETSKKSKRQTNTESSAVKNSSTSNLFYNPWQRLAETLQSKSPSDTEESEDNEKIFEISLNNEAAPTRKPFQWTLSEEKELSQEDSSEVEYPSDSIEIIPLKDDVNKEFNFIPHEDGIKSNEVEIIGNEIVSNNSNSRTNLQTTEMKNGANNLQNDKQVSEINTSFKNNNDIQKAEENYQLGVKHFYGRSIKSTGFRVNKSKALEHYKIAADLGHPWACFALGSMYKNGDIKKSFFYYKFAADHGISDANQFVGEMYYNGNGVEQDFDKAFDYLELAVDRSSINICYKLGMMYLNGEAVKQDYTKAIKWLHSIANKDKPDAWFELGKIYSEVSEVKDFEKAVKYLTLYINKPFKPKTFILPYLFEDQPDDEKNRVNTREALRYLGLIYYLGENGIEKNLGNAYKYLSEAKTQGDTESADFLYKHFNSDDIKFYSRKMAAESGDKAMQYFIGLAYLEGKDVESNLAEAVKYLKLAADQWHPIAASKLGMIYYTGSEGLMRNYVEAFKYLKIAADVNVYDTESATLVGRMYVEGKGTQANLEEAGKYSIGAANKGNPVAQGTMGLICLESKDIVRALGYFMIVKDQINDVLVQLSIGMLYYAGQVVKQNFNKAFKYLKRAADLGDARAQSLLGNMYRNGLGIQPDLEKAFEYYKRSADKGKAVAQANVGVMYLIGKAVVQNSSEGIEYLKLSAAQGNLKATENLGIIYFNGAHGVGQDFAAAYHYLMISLHKGSKDPQCMYYVGLLYKNGHVVEKNAEAFTYLMGASDLGLEDATFEIGNIYSEGILYPPDLTQAILYYTKVAQKGGAKAEAARERIKVCQEMLKNKGSGL